MNAIDVIGISFLCLALIAFGVTCIDPKASLYYEPRDCWVGLYWKTEQQMSPVFCRVTTWYLCIIPCFPIIWETKSK